MSPRRVLLVTFYYPPDLCAGSFRAGPLVDALLALSPADVEIDVITTFPNRYAGFISAADAEEVHGRLTIRRIQLSAHQSGMLDQARAFWHFWRAGRRLSRGRRYDLVIATSSRLMTAVLGASIARRARAPLYLDIRDIFVDTIADVLRGPVATVMKPFFSSLERRTIRAAAHVNLVSRGFAPYFESRYPGQSLSFFTNGIDDEFLDTGVTATPPSQARALRVLYAGNMGEGQGLHAIVPELARRLQGRATFRLVGDGGRRARLAAAIADAGVTNVELLDPVSRAQLIEEYRSADVLFLHLNDYEAFKKVLPSKVFEYAAMGKPVWAGVAGYSAEFIKTEVSNAAVFPPCDAEAAIAAFDTLKQQTAPRESFAQKYARRAIMSELAADMLRFLKPKPRT